MRKFTAARPEQVSTFQLPLHVTHMLFHILSSSFSSFFGDGGGVCGCVCVFVCVCLFVCIVCIYFVRVCVCSSYTYVLYLDCLCF